MTTILTLAMDAASQAHFDELRKKHYPSHLNRIAAHLTLFHSLPDTDDVRAAIAEIARESPPFPMRVKNVMSLGRGVAFAIHSPELEAVHAQLARAFHAHLIPQDKQPFRAHVVIQNKVGSKEASDLRATLEANFAPWAVAGEGLDWWNYLNGPWEIRERFTFMSKARGAMRND